MYVRITAVLFLVCLSVCDLRSRTIPVWPIPLFTVMSAAAHLVLRDLPVMDILTGILPGVFFLVLAVIYSSSIGMGDALVIAACGLAVGFTAEFCALVTALVLCAAYAAAALIAEEAGCTVTDAEGNPLSFRGSTSALCRSRGVSEIPACFRRAEAANKDCKGM